MLLHRYHNIDFIMTLDVETAISLIQKAFEQRDEERQYALYISIYPHFDKKTFKTFDDFYKKPSKSVSTRSAEEIMSKAEEILKKVGDKSGIIQAVRNDPC